MNTYVKLNTVRFCQFIYTVYILEKNMDIRKFLHLVQQHKCLWDPNDLYYSFRDQAKLSWVKISKEMHVPGIFISINFYSNISNAYVLQ